MNFDSAQPIWRQLVVDFTRRIIIGEWKPGMKIPSTRELALEYQVNPNTVQRALAELDRTGTTQSERTSGRFVSEDGESLEALRGESAQEIIDDAITRLNSIRVQRDDAVKLLNQRWRTHD
ncbi:GntR family transcriptional regulator [Yaniella flava]|uniref:GntR family transcriptional regulator n=1 Tax=Yaniella flava TaxID=287930 RepID=A0ABP5G5V7_9MICC